MLHGIFVGSSGPEVTADMRHASRMQSSIVMSALPRCMFLHEFISLGALLANPSLITCQYLAFFALELEVLKIVGLSRSFLVLVLDSSFGFSFWVILINHTNIQQKDQIYCWTNYSTEHVSFPPGSQCIDRSILTKVLGYYTTTLSSQSMQNTIFLLVPCCSLSLPENNMSLSTI